MFAFSNLNCKDFRITTAVKSEYPSTALILPGEVCVDMVVRIRSHDRVFKFRAIRENCRITTGTKLESAGLPYIVQITSLKTLQIAFFSTRPRERISEFAGCERDAGSPLP